MTTRRSSQYCFNLFHNDPVNLRIYLALHKWRQQPKREQRQAKPTTSSFPCRRKSSLPYQFCVADNAMLWVLSHCVGHCCVRLVFRLRGNDGYTIIYHELWKYQYMTQKPPYSRIVTRLDLHLLTNSLLPSANTIKTNHQCDSNAFFPCAVLKNGINLFLQYCQTATFSQKIM